MKYKLTTEDGIPKSFCCEPKRSPTGLPRGINYLLYIHTSSLNNRVKYGVSYSATLQEEQDYDPIECYPLEMKYYNIEEIVKALFNPTGQPSEAFAPWSNVSFPLTTCMRQTVSHSVRKAVRTYNRKRKS